MKKPLNYTASGVRYTVMDTLKRRAQKYGRRTAENLTSYGAAEVTGSRGESAYVWDEKDSYRAFVMEGLGTKNLIADAFGRVTGKTYYDAIARDTVAMIVNDLVVVGASPMVVSAYFAVGDSEWFTNTARGRDLIRGWASACRYAGAAWGGGETATLKEILNPGAIDLAGSAVGRIYPKTRLTLGDKIAVGDAIVFIESSGIHANGLTLARTIADRLPKKYKTKLSDDSMYGEALLRPSHIYARVVRDIFNAGVDIHYMVHITGHGWRKLMRADKKVSYIIETVPGPQPIFSFLQKHSGTNDSEMYGTFNMGAGFALYLRPSDTEKVIRAVKKHHMRAWVGGFVESGPKQVIIKEKNIVFSSNTLKIR